MSELLLHDIRLGPKLGIWPFAWGYWVLICLCFSCLFFLYVQRHYWRALYDKKRMMRQLQDMYKTYQTQKNSSVSLADLAFFLKQSAMYYYPREQVAHLYGEAWLQFLASTAKNLAIDECKPCFCEALYQAHCDLDVSLAFDMAKSWLAQQRSPCMN